jgi:hypothetical protein
MSEGEDERPTVESGHGDVGFHHGPHEPAGVLQMVHDLRPGAAEHLHRTGAALRVRDLALARRGVGSSIRAVLRSGSGLRARRCRCLGLRRCNRLRLRSRLDLAGLINGLTVRGRCSTVRRRGSRGRRGHLWRLLRLLGGDDLGVVCSQLGGLELVVLLCGRQFLLGGHEVGHGTRGTTRSGLLGRLVCGGLRSGRSGRRGLSRNVGRLRSLAGVVGVLRCLGLLRLLAGLSLEGIEVHRSVRNRVIGGMRLGRGRGQRGRGDHAGHGRQVGHCRTGSGRTRCCGCGVGRRRRSRGGCCACLRRFGRGGRIGGPGRSSAGGMRSRGGGSWGSG